MINRRRIERLERKVVSGQPQVVWVNEGETPQEACERSGFKNENSTLVDTGIGKILFVRWRI